MSGCVWVGLAPSEPVVTWLVTGFSPPGVPTSTANGSTENPPRRPDQRVHARRLTPGGAAGHPLNPIFERDKVRVGLRCERLADPQVKFVPGQPSLHERGLELIDHLLAVGM